MGVQIKIDGFHIPNVSQEAVIALGKNAVTNRTNSKVNDGVLLLLQDGWTIQNNAVSMVMDPDLVDHPIIQMMNYNAGMK